MNREARRRIDSELNRRGQARVAHVQEPDAKGCEPEAVWQIRLRQDQLLGSNEIEIRCRRRDGEITLVRLPAAERAHPRRVLDQLRNFNARLPEDPAFALRFVETLMAEVPAAPVTSTCQPGWRDVARGFVMPTQRYGTSRGKVIWDADAAPTKFGEIRGTRRDYEGGVLRLACQSTFITIAVLIGLTAPLLGYVRDRRNKRLMSETALFHWAGATSSGKSTLARITQSVIGAPGEMSDYRTSERGIAEEAYSRNDLVAIFDEAEHGEDDDRLVLQRMSLICRGVTAGRSRGISRIAKGSLPTLEWSCFGISTGPVTQASVSSRLNKLRHGQAARFIDLSVPLPDVGGIFDKMRLQDHEIKSVASARLVKTIDRCIEANHGVLFPHWIEYLLQNDVSERAERITREFAAKLSGGAGGLEERVAAKIAVLYATAVIGIDAGLLPWSERWVRYAVTSTHRNALAQRDPESVEVDRAISRLSQWVPDHMRFPRVTVTPRGVPVFDLDADAIGFIVCGTNGKRRGYLLRERLWLVGVNEHRLQTRVCKKLAAKASAIGRVTPSEQFWIRRDGEGVQKKVRAWEISRLAMRGDGVYEGQGDQSASLKRYPSRRSSKGLGESP